ncbi:MAG: hypothetical protein Q8P51_13685 [Ignavibacteria bacterium]|nr:hypothetical protein [Ignavibacteria bacterium]
MTPEQKKESEKLVLKKFIRAYKEQIDSNSSFRVLDIDDAKSVFPSYNGENPDFVVSLDGKHIAIELVRLMKKHVDSSHKIPFEEKIDIKTAAHLYSKRKENKTEILSQMESLAEAAIDQLNHKIRTKLDNYIKCPIWLVAYASDPYNLFILSPYFEDRIEKEIASFISKNILDDTRFDEIWLSEFSSQDYLLRIR